MKGCFSVLIVTLLASLIGLAGCTNNKSITVATSLTTLFAEDAPVPVVLPTLADVVIKGGASKSGRLTEIDGKGQRIKMELSGVSNWIAIAQIKKITFKPDAAIYSNGKLVIRGEDKPSASKQKTWAGIPLSDFQLQNPNTGEAKVTLKSSAVDKAKLPGIQAVAKDSLFVVEEIQFEPPGKMTLNVTTVDR